jgi:hypothetical protein
VLVQTKGLSREAFDAIAGDRGAEGARRDAQAQSRMGFMIGQDRQTEIGIGEFLPRSFTSRNSAGWCKRLRGSNVSL